MRPTNDQTIVRTRKTGPYSKAVRINTATYAQIIALQTTMNVDAATVVRAGIAALFAGFYIRRHRIARSTNDQRGPVPISQIKFKPNQPSQGYEEGTE